MRRHWTSHALATCAAAAALVLTGCTGDEPEPATVDRTWTVPDDVCDRLDLAGRLAEGGATGTAPGAASAGQDSVTCTATGDEDLVVTVVLRTVGDRDRYDLAWQNAVAQIVPSSVWESLGPVDTATPEAGSWPGTTYARRFTSIQPGGADDRLDTTRVARVEALGDANVVVSVGVLTTSTEPSEDVVDLVDEVGSAVADSLTTALERRN